MDCGDQFSIWEGSLQINREEAGVTHVAMETQCRLVQHDTNTGGHWQEFTTDNVHPWVSVYTHILWLCHLSGPSRNIPAAVSTPNIQILVSKTISQQRNQGSLENWGLGEELCR